MKRFSKLAIVAIWLAAPLSAWAGPASDRADTAAASAAPRKAARDYWLGREIGRLALLLPSHKAEETTRR